MNTLGLCLTAAAKEPLDALLKRRVMDPIGADPGKWKWGDRGLVEIAGTKIKVNSGSGNGGGHVQISARELARFGHLFLNGGRWSCQQLLPAAWVREATRCRFRPTYRTGFPGATSRDQACTVTTGGSMVRNRMAGFAGRMDQQERTPPAATTITACG